MLTLHLFHTNDLHSHFQRWGALVHYLNIERSRLDQLNEPYLTLDLGDHMDRVNPLTEGLLGTGNVQLLNDAHYDAVTIGNNEGITFTKAQIGAAYSTRAFTVVLANLFEDSGERPDWCRPFMIRDMAGVSVGFIGLTAAYPKFYRLLGWDVHDPLETLRPLVHELRPQVDVLVLLSHVGLPFDRLVAEEVTGIDVIIGAHTHHALEQGEVVNGTLIAQAGKYGRYAGHITIEYDQDEGRVAYKGADLITLREAADPAADRQVKELSAAGIARMQQPIAVLKKPLVSKWYQDSEISGLLADALRNWCDADIGLVNAGAILDGLPAGTVTRYQVHQICPHPINPCRVTLSGAQLVEIAERGLGVSFQNYALKGFGFRGKVIGQLVFSHLKYRLVTRDGKRHVCDVTIDDLPVVFGKIYSVGTIDMFTFGHMLPPIVSAPQQFYLPETLRDLLAWRLQMGPNEPAASPIHV